MRDIKALAERFIDKARGGNETYVLMSVREVNEDTWISYPYIAVNPDDRKFITVFDSLEDAKKYVDKYGYKKAFGDYPIAKLPSDISKLTRFLFGLFHNHIELVAVMDEEETGAYCDILHLVQMLGAKLNVGMYSRYIDLLPLIGHENTIIRLEDDEDFDD